MIDSKAFIAELDAIDRMSPDELRVEACKLANEPTLAGFVAKLACIRDAKARHQMKSPRAALEDAVFGGFAP